MKKWMKLAESVPPVLVGQDEKHARIKQDATVMVDPKVGGGTGRFIDYVPGGAKIDIKGVERELSDDDFALPTRDYEDPYDSANAWFHSSNQPKTVGTMNDKPEFRPGDMVEVSDVYGSVIGPGIGIFVAYGTTGQDCVISFDNKQMIIPIANVAAMLEQDAKDNFKETDNDGNLSPMSLGSDNVKIEQEPAMDHRDEFSKWLSKVEEALNGELDVNMLPQQAQECGCQSWNCPVCFPEPEGHVVDAGGDEGACPTCGHVCSGHGGDEVAMEPELGIADLAPGPEVGSLVANLPVVDELEEVPMEDYGCSMEEEVPMEEEPQVERPRSGKGVKLGDIIQKYVPVGNKDGAKGNDSPLTYGDELEEAGFEDEEPDYDAMGPAAMSDLNAERAGQAEFAMASDADIAQMEEMAGKIKYIQDMGLSKSSRIYSEADFASMNPSQMKAAYHEVVGNDPTNHGQPTMENIDQDVQLWMQRFKDYDALREGAKKVDIPAVQRKEKAKGGDDWKVTQADLDKDDEKNLSSKRGLDKAKKDAGITEDRIDELSPSTLSSYRTKALSQANQTGGIAKALDRSAGSRATDKESDSIRHSNVTDPNLKYGGGGDEYAKMSQKRFAGAKQAAQKGAVEESMQPDQEVIEWMQRFSKLGDMKGYGR